MLTPHQVKSLIEALKNDKIVVMPTDTIYGIGAKNSFSNKKKINRLKRAPLEKPLILIISNYQQLAALVKPNEYIEYSHFLDKGFTIVFRQRNNFDSTIAIRLVNRSDLSQVIDSVGPLWSTSTNVHGEPILTNLKAIKKQFPQLLVFQDEDFTPGKPSKIYDTINKRWLR